MSYIWPTCSRSKVQSFRYGHADHSRLAGRAAHLIWFSLDTNGWVPLNCQGIGCNKNTQNEASPGSSNLDTDLSVRWVGKVPSGVTPRF